jgi:hypothetical protein
MVEHREVLVKQLVQASKGGDVNKMNFLGGSISEVDRLVSGKFENIVEYRIEEIKDGR